MTNTPATIMAWLKRMLQFIFFIIHCLMFLWLYVQDTCNDLLCHRLRVFLILDNFFSWLHPVQCFWRSISKSTCCNHYVILNETVPTLIYYLFIFMITPRLMCLGLFIQGTCNYWSMVKETVSNLNSFLNQTLSNVSVALCPGHLQILYHG